MKKLIATILLLFSVLFPLKDINAATVIYSDSNKIYQAHPNNIELLKTMSTKRVQALLGRKLSLKEKAGLFFLKKSKKFYADPGDKEVVKSKKGTWSLILGISSFLLLGPLGAIPAIILGVQALKENPNDTNASIGKVLGIIYLALTLVAVIAVIAILSSGGWTF